MRDDATARGELKAVIFDVDGTLYRQGPLRRAIAIRLLRAHLLHPIRGIHTARAIAGYRHAQEELRDLAEGRDLSEAQVLMAAERTGLHRDEITSAVARWMESEPLDLLARFAQPNMDESLRVLQARGLRLAVLSDYPAEAKLRAMGIADLFDVVVCAQDREVGVFKPHPRGLQVALERLGVDASEALYVGDRADVDAAAAAAASVPCVILDAAGRGGTEPDFALTKSFRDMTKMLEPT